MLKIIRAGMYTSVQDGGVKGCVSWASAAVALWISRRWSPLICWWVTALTPRRWR